MGLSINEGPTDVIFEAPTQGTKPTGIFKTNIEALGKFVGTLFSKDAHIAAKAMRDGEELAITKNLKDGASLWSRQSGKKNTWPSRTRSKTGRQTMPLFLSCCSNIEPWP